MMQRSGSREGHLQAIDDMRGLAILAIVILHAANAVLNRGLAAPPTGSTRLGAAANDILFHNSTIYFALISGILYAHLFVHRPYRSFLVARFANVGSPFLVMTVALTVLLALVRPDETLGDVPNAILRNLLLGEAWNTFWYIPVILMLYAISPLLFTVMTDRRFAVLATILLVQPLLLSRTGTELTPQMFAFYAGVYCCGLLIGADIPRAIAWLRRDRRLLWWAVAAAVTALGLLHAAGLDHVGNGRFTISARESVTYILRLATAGLILPLLFDWTLPPDRQPRKGLGLVAATSFGVYFLHGPLLRPIARLLGPLVPPDQPAFAVLLVILLAAASALLLSLVVLLVAKRLLGPRSRYLTGY